MKLCRGCFNQAAMKCAGLPLVREPLACELVGPFPAWNEAWPVKPFCDHQTGTGVCGNLCIQKAFSPVIEYSHKVPLIDGAFLGIFRADQ